MAEKKKEHKLKGEQLEDVIASGMVGGVNMIFSESAEVVEGSIAMNDDCLFPSRD